MRSTQEVLREVQAALIKLAAELAQGIHIPTEFDDGGFYKSTPVAERRRIRIGRERLEEHGKVTGIKLRELFDKLSPLLCTSDETLSVDSNMMERLQNERLTWGVACPCSCDACERFYDVIRDMEDKQADARPVCPQCGQINGFHRETCPLRHSEKASE